MIELLEHEALYGVKKKAGRRGRVIDPEKDGRTKKGRLNQQKPKTEKPKDTGNEKGDH